MGALTLKTNAFQTRPWEILNKDYIAVNDPFLPTIKIKIRDQNIYKIEPKENEEEWINDISRLFKKYISEKLSGAVSETLPKSKKVQFGLDSESTFSEHSNQNINKYLQNNYYFKNNVKYILNENTDITTLEILKNFDENGLYLKSHVHNPYSFGETTNINLEEDTLNMASMVIMLELKKFSVLFWTQLQTLYDEGSELFTLAKNTKNVILDCIFCRNFLALLFLGCGSFWTANLYYVVTSNYFKNLLSSEMLVQTLSETIDYSYIFKNKQNNLLTPVVTLNSNILWNTVQLCVLGLTASLEKGYNFFISTLTTFKNYSIFKKDNKIFFSFPTLVLLGQSISAQDCLKAFLNAFPYFYPCDYSNGNSEPSLLGFYSSGNSVPELKKIIEKKKKHIADIKKKLGQLEKKKKNYSANLVQLIKTQIFLSKNLDVDEDLEPYEDPKLKIYLANIKKNAYYLDAREKNAYAIDALEKDKHHQQKLQKQLEEKREYVKKRLEFLQESEEKFLEFLEKSKIYKETQKKKVP